MTPAQAQGARDRAAQPGRDARPAEPSFNKYPHQLSGGQRQRAMIAQSISCDPLLLIADEPTTALDVTVQAEILELLRNLHKRLDSAIILITHDMGVVADLADKHHGDEGRRRGRVRRRRAGLPAPDSTRTRSRCSRPCRTSARASRTSTRRSSPRRTASSSPCSSSRMSRSSTPSAAACPHSGQPRTSTSRSTPARSSAWLASPDRARRRSAAPRSACCRSRRASSRSSATTSRMPATAT